ncbi:hypothetical protein U1Q18_045064 [Sarracenia purpurea var. burkii]
MENVLLGMLESATSKPDAFAEAGNEKHMAYILDQMCREGLKADTKNLCRLIKRYVDAGIFHKVISTVQLAGELEIAENTSFDNAVIFACAKAEDLMERGSI